MPRVMEEIKFELSPWKRKSHIGGNQKLYTSAVGLWPDREDVSN